ncbi:hypothetical protein FQN54_008660 [Arachnomyces sp. PD_36]|nr:hypothetical protein FQN54_008660 [Arachnomyces sp. PD_36]
MFSSTAFVGIVLLLLIRTAVKVVERVFFSPLSNLPGPLIAKLTGQWILFVDLAGHRAKTIHKLHEEYGSVVQLGPNELSFSSSESIEPIYGIGTQFRKAPAYKAMARPGIFNMRDPAAHRERRRLMNHAFSQQHLHGMEPAFHTSMKKLIARIEQQDGKALDVRHWFRMYTLDNAGEAFLGTSFGGLDYDEAPQYVKDFDMVFLAWAVEGTFPLISRLLKMIPHPKVQFFFGTDNRIYQYGFDRFSEYIQRHGRVSQRKDLLTKMIGSKENDPDAIADQDIAVEISNLCFAATDTTAITLIYLFWELGRNSALAEQLRAELAGIPLHEGVIRHRSVSDLPFLDAVITETLRLYTATPSGLQRETPMGGWTLDGIYVPQQTVVSTNTWTTHHNPNYFPEPYRFDPSRWLGNVSEEMKKLWMPFSKGPRNCIGQAMALFEMKILTATLVKRYNITVDDAMSAHDMEIMDHFLIIPKGQECLLKFTPI